MIDRSRASAKQSMRYLHLSWSHIPMRPHLHAPPPVCYPCLFSKSSFSHWLFSPLSKYYFESVIHKFTIFHLTAPTSKNKPQQQLILTGKAGEHVEYRKTRSLLLLLLFCLFVFLYSAGSQEYRRREQWSQSSWYISRPICFIFPELCGNLLMHQVKILGSHLGKLLIWKHLYEKMSSPTLWPIWKPVWRRKQKQSH